MSSRPSQRDETGAVSAEYAILLVFVALAVVVGMIALAVAVMNLYATGAEPF
jgi:Flp pilus assembly pilin Flp